jgi:hypothetical protein
MTDPINPDEHKLFGKYYPEVGIEKYDGEIPAIRYTVETEKTALGFTFKVMDGVHQVGESYMSLTHAEVEADRLNKLKD